MWAITPHGMSIERLTEKAGSSEKDLVVLTSILYEIPCSEDGENGH